MFCPRCATQNADNAHFCRSCGANVSLVPQALTGQLADSRESAPEIHVGRGRRRDRKTLTLDQACKNFFMGISFLLVSIALSFSIGRGWWFWMLIPAFSMMGTGLAQYLRLKEYEKQALRTYTPAPPLQAPPRENAFPSPQTGELRLAPPSITEGTTRHLGGEAATRNLDTSNKVAK